MICHPNPVHTNHQYHHHRQNQIAVYMSWKKDKKNHIQTVLYVLLFIEFTAWVTLQCGIPKYNTPPPPQKKCHWIRKLIIDTEVFQSVKSLFKNTFLLRSIKENGIFVQQLCLIILTLVLTVCCYRHPDHIQDYPHPQSFLLCLSSIFPLKKWSNEAMRGGKRLKRQEDGNSSVFPRLLCDWDLIVWQRKWIHL